MISQTNSPRVRLAKLCLITAGVLLLLETLLGVFYVLGIGFANLTDILTDLCLTMAFPIFLIGLASLRSAAVGLWIFFLAQWINAGLFSPHSHLHISNPLDWFHGDATFIGAVLVSFSAWSLSRASVGEEAATLRAAFLSRR